jgi:hypothetical protein
VIAGRACGLRESRHTSVDRLKLPLPSADESRRVPLETLACAFAQARFHSEKCPRVRRERWSPWKRRAKRIFLRCDSRPSWKIVLSSSQADEPSANLARETAKRRPDASQISRARPRSVDLTHRQSRAPSPPRYVSRRARWSKKTVLPSSSTDVSTAQPPDGHFARKVPISTTSALRRRFARRADVVWLEMHHPVLLDAPRSDHARADACLFTALRTIAKFDEERSATK